MILNSETKKRSILLIAFCILYSLMPFPALADDSLLDLKLFAHRGFAVNYPENSLASLRDAADMGLYGSETDLRTTKDGHIVLLHDETLDRTTTGTGAIADLTLEQVRGFFLKDSQGKPTDLKVPTLTETLEMVRSFKSFRLALDLKAVDVEKAGQAVLSSGLGDRVFFFIPDPMDVETAEKIRKVSPDLKISVDLLTWWKIKGLPTFVKKSLHADALFASEWFFPRFGFKEARDAGAEVQVYLWGNHDLPERLKKAAMLGAQVVSCDRPDQLLHLVRRN